ncbi:MAG: hypothetical protein IPG23_18755 [Burkholderiales bacterium]|nr:hypothetical protein [Burkholderiales bacterium]
MPINHKYGYGAADATAAVNAAKTWVNIAAAKNGYRLGHTALAIPDAGAAVTKRNIADQLADIQIRVRRELNVTSDQQPMWVISGSR